MLQNNADPCEITFPQTSEAISEQSANHCLKWQYLVLLYLIMSSLKERNYMQSSVAVTMVMFMRWAHIGFVAGFSLRTNFLRVFQLKTIGIGY